MNGIFALIDGTNDDPGYSALDFTILDPHYGTLQQWTDLIDALHARGMYIILDFTVGTMGDLIGFVECVTESRASMSRLTLASVI